MRIDSIAVSMLLACSMGGCLLPEFSNGNAELDSGIGANGGSGGVSVGGAAGTPSDASAGTSGSGASGGSAGATATGGSAGTGGGTGGSSGAAGNGGTTGSGGGAQCPTVEPKPDDPCSTEPTCHFDQAACWCDSGSWKCADCPQFPPPYGTSCSNFGPNMVCLYGSSTCTCSLSGSWKWICGNT